jgi:signal transduction histidine kinase
MGAQARALRGVPRRHSIRARYTIIAMALLLLALAAVGAGFDLAIRYKIQDEIFFNAQRVAGQVGATIRSGDLPHSLPASPGASLIQVVDVHGRVLAASPLAANRPPMSTLRPPPEDRLRRLTKCSAQGECVMLTADRVTPAADALVVYAGVPEPPLLATHSLEYLIAAGVLGLVIPAGWLTWWVVGRTIRPVEVIRARMSEITERDLSQRVPVPPGQDEIALLARTANQTLSRLEGAVAQQREFASTTSHELRSPIAGLRTRLEEAVHYPDEVDQRDVIQGALSCTGRLEAIIDDLLTLARLRAADPAPPELIDLGALVRQEVAGQDPGVPVSVHTAPGVWVSGSRIQLVRVLGNLLSNARRHADTGVEVSVESMDGRATVAVSDDGAGVPPADRERVFERFTRLADGRRRDSGGSGLGLAISRDIAQAHQGSLRIEDSTRGARFVLRLPLTDPTSHQSH